VLVASQERIFDRTQEQEELRSVMQERRTFLLHGDAGTGKSLLLRAVCQGLPNVIFCQANNSMQQLCRRLAITLADGGNRAARSKLDPSPAVRIRSITSVSLRGLIAQALQQEAYTLVLDHFGFASQLFAGTLKKWAAGPTAIVIVARSPHMEEIGYVAPWFAERKDKFALSNFDPEVASRFAEWAVENQDLQADNLEEFKQRIVVLTQGNPGMISALVRLAALPKYRNANSIKVAPLYLDFKLYGSAAGQLP
jgi:hypothetical protein